MSDGPELDGPGTDARRDAGGADAATCSSASACDDGVYCNGAETCTSGVCGTGSPPCAAASCDEAADTCACGNPDADGDGANSMACGGTDCDDDDAGRAPGRPEVCDTVDHDEDCDGATFGFRDNDGDAYADATCCNVDAAGARTCGDDCNDSRPNVHPTLAEACDELDNDCDTTTDEGVGRVFYPDADGDGFGDELAPSTSWMMGCLLPSGFAESATDCLDSDASVHPGALEQCDVAMLDENCDGTANPATLCMCAGDVTRACATLGGVCAAGTERCIGGSWGLCSITPIAEVCNGLDDDCDASSDEMLFVRCYPDGDNDGYADAAAMEVQACPVPGRDAFAGCPPNQTNRPPVGATAIDCNDANSTISPGSAELCDVALVDEDCDGVANPSSLCMCTDGQTRTCMAMGSCGAGSQTCIGGRFSSCTVNPVAESCNGTDDDCDGNFDEGLTITCYADNDNDGSAPAGASPTQSCPVMGRGYVGGCPTGQTNVAPGAGTTDCNDMSTVIGPAAIELCDAAMVDEDCDGMANPAALCSCSGTSTRPCPQGGACAAGTQTCGGGSWGLCSILPVSEVCNGVDDNCNGTTDEGATVTCYADGDNDGYSPTMAATDRCPDSSRASLGSCPIGFTNRAGTAGAVDCSDTNAALNPGVIELCDMAMVDENCDGMANPMSLCACSGTAMRVCPLPGACAAGSQTCSSGSWSSCSIGPVAESCNSIDDNCNGSTDEGTTVTCYADADNDGYSATATAMQRCPDASRPALGGCPVGLTNRVGGAGTTDCNDANAAVSPGAPEVCDAAMLDENCDGMANPAALCACSGAGTRSCPLPGVCATGTQTCVSGAWSSCSVTGSAEICNGLDDDCDATIDDNGSGGYLTITCYLDADSDGYGTGSSVARCPDASRSAAPYNSCPTGYTGNATDCNDGNASIRPTAAELCNGVDDNCVSGVDEGLTTMCYVDADGDAYGTGAISSRCTDMSMARMAFGYCPSGYTTMAADCLDTNASVHPGVAETCNGIDDDCDSPTQIDEGVSTSFYRDTDGDGFGAGAPISACGAPSGYVASSTDCNDACASCHPGGTETCDGLDNDCASGVDNGVTVQCYLDADNDTYSPMGSVASTRCPVAGRSAWGGCPMNLTSTQPVMGMLATIDCADNDGARSPGATETCNGVDDDCDTVIDDGVQHTYYRDADGDGWGLLAMTAQACTPPAGYTDRAGDCDDGNAGRNPSSVELCDGIDNDCNAVIDPPPCMCVDGSSMSCGMTSTGACALGTQVCSGGTWSSCIGVIDPIPEACNGADDDCDGTSDDGLGCRLGTSQACVTGCGTAGTQVCRSDCTGWEACRAATETCNGCDDDLNGVDDDGFGCVRGRIYSCTTSCGTASTRVCSNSCTLPAACYSAEACNYCDDDGDGSQYDEEPIALDYFNRSYPCAELRMSGAATCSGSTVTLDAFAINSAGAAWTRSPVQLGYGAMTVELPRVPFAVLSQSDASATAPYAGWSLYISDVDNNGVNEVGAAGLCGAPTAAAPARTGIVVRWLFRGTNPDYLDVDRVNADGSQTSIAFQALPCPGGGSACHLDGGGELDLNQQLTVIFTPANPVTGTSRRLQITTPASSVPILDTTSNLPNWGLGTNLWVGMTAGSGSSGTELTHVINAFPIVTMAEHCYADGSVRVAGGGTSGRVEVFHAGQWGTVCDDSFDANDATVACRRMGFTSGTVVTNISTPDGTGQIWLDDLACVGSESGLSFCPSNGWGIHNCTHAEDVGVNCS